MQAFQHRCAVADIGYKVPVHHVKVHQVDTGLQQAGAVMLQVGKISDRIDAAIFVIMYILP